MNAAPDAIINGFQPQISSLLGNVTHSVSEFQKMSASEHMRRQRAKKRKDMTDMSPALQLNHPTQAFAQQVQPHIQTATLARPTQVLTPAPAVPVEDEEREKKRKMSIQALLSLDTGIVSPVSRNWRYYSNSLFFTIKFCYSDRSFCLQPLNIEHFDKYKQIFAVYVGTKSVHNLMQSTQLSHWACFRRASKLWTPITFLPLKSHVGNAFIPMEHDYDQLINLECPWINQQRTFILAVRIHRFRTFNTTLNKGDL